MLTQKNCSAFTSGDTTAEGIPHQGRPAHHEEDTSSRIFRGPSRSHMGNSLPGRSLTKGEQLYAAAYAADVRSMEALCKQATSAATALEAQEVFARTAVSSCRRCLPAEPRLPPRM